MYCVCRWCPWWLMNLPVSRKHRRGGQPAFVLRRQLVQRLQLAKKLQRVRAHRLGLARIDAIAPRRRQHALPALVLELAMRRGARVLLGQHLRQDAVAQPQRRIAKARQPEALQQLGEYLRSGHDNLRPPRPDARHRFALGQRHLGELAGQLAHCLCRGHSRRQGRAALARRLPCCAVLRAGLRILPAAGSSASASAAAVPEVAITSGTLPGMNPAMRPPQLARNQLPHPRQVPPRRGIGLQKLLGQPHRAQRQADRLLDALVLGERDLAAAAAQVDQQHPAARSRLRTHHAAMDQPAFFEAGDDLHVPAGLGLHPRLKGRRVARIAHGRCGHHANLVHPVRLHRALKPLERPQRGRHGLRRDQPRIEDARPSRVTSRSSCSVFKLVRHDLGNLQPAGVGTDIDGGKGGHGCVARLLVRRKSGSGVKIHDRAAP